MAVSEECGSRRQRVGLDHVLFCPFGALFTRTAPISRTPGPVTYRESEHPRARAGAAGGQWTEKARPAPDGLPSAGGLDGGFADLKIGARFSDVDREDRVAAMEAEMRAAVTSIVESGRLREWLDLCANNGMSRWSFNNQILAWGQAMRAREEASPEELDGCPGTPMVMSANDWKTKYDRFPRKGSKAIWVLAPVTRRFTDTDEKTGEEKARVAVVGFTGQAKFDACQTDGAPIPGQAIVQFGGGEPPEGVYAHLTGKVEEAGYAYSERPLSDGPVNPTGLLGYTDPKTRQVVVDSRLPATAKVFVIAHELGHIHCGHVDRPGEYGLHRGVAETEAEATAYMVMRHLGVRPADADSFSAGYIASWSKGDPDAVSKAMSRASGAFRKITSGAEDQWTPKTADGAPRAPRTPRTRRATSRRSPRKATAAA